MSLVLKCIFIGLVFLSGPANAFFGLFEPNVEPIKERLKDPYSAKFHDVNDIGEGVVCGQVNSKNSMGAYVGKEPFAIRGKTAYLAKESPDEYKFLCVTFAQCVANKQKPSASACMEHVTAQRDEAEKKKKEAQLAIRNDPRIEKLKKYGWDACNEWYSFNGRPADGYRKVADCKVEVSRCGENHRDQGYEQVYQCLGKIRMISNSVGRFMFYLTMDPEIKNKP